MGLLGRKRPTVGEAPTVATRYNELIAIGGFPPKGVWIRRGNSPTNEIETLRRTHRDALEALTNDPDAGLLALL